MNAECARPTCEEPARVLLAFDPRTARAWLRDLDNGDPSMGLLLCTEHAESTSVPVSWEIVDERRTVPEFSSQIYDSEPSFDDIFPPRAGYSSWETIPYDDAPPPPRHDSIPAPKRGDDGERYTPRNEQEDVSYDPGPDRAQVASAGAWYDTERSGQPDWLERAESLDFGLDDYYDPYLDDPELSDPGFPTEFPATPSGAGSITSAASTGTHIAGPEPSRPESEIESASPDPARPEPARIVAPLIRPGSPEEPVRASELLAAAAVDPPQPIPPRTPSSPLSAPASPTVPTKHASARASAARDAKLHKDAVRLPERADVSRRDQSQADAATDAAHEDTPPQDLAASGTDGAPFPPHPGARNAGD